MQLSAAPCPSSMYLAGPVRLLLVEKRDKKEVYIWFVVNARRWYGACRTKPGGSWNRRSVCWTVLGLVHTNLFY